MLVLCLYAIAADGQALIWEIPAKVPSLPTSGELAISPLLPLARIRDSLGAGITRQDLSFDPETNMLLVRIQEKKIRYSMCLVISMGYISPIYLMSNSWFLFVFSYNLVGF